MPNIKSTAPSSAEFDVEIDSNSASNLTPRENEIEAAAAAPKGEALAPPKPEAAPAAELKLEANADERKTSTSWYGNGYIFNSLFEVNDVCLNANSINSKSKKNLRSVLFSHKKIAEKVRKSWH